jgi:class 3 adenylate cyclase
MCSRRRAKTTGDAFFAAFTTPWLALDAALAMQQALQAEAWPPQSPIRVRMALHSGAGVADHAVR